MELRLKSFFYFLSLFLLSLSTVNVAQSLPNSLELNSQRISGVRDHIEKANQSQAVWLDGNWWGCFRSTSGNDNWRIYNLTLDSLNNGNWSSVTSLGVDSEDRSICT